MSISAPPSRISDLSSTTFRHQQRCANPSILLVRKPKRQCLVHPCYASKGPCSQLHDALLEETLRNFCHSPRRYGSNVPGPLEARRRASKRKNTSLAHAGSGHEQMSYDPAIMLGNSSTDKWWKHVQRTSSIQSGHPRDLSRKEAEAHISSILPAWLLQYPGLSIESSPTPIQSGQAEACSEDQDPSFRNSIRETTNLDQVEQVVQNTKFNLRKYPDLAEHAFKHLIELCQPSGYYVGLVRALYDPLLNPPGSRNHLILFEHLKSVKISRHMWEKVLFPAFLKAVELGLVSAESLQKIILLIPGIHQTDLASRSSNRIHADWHAILTSLQRSRVLSLQDLNAKFGGDWYHQIKSALQTDSTCLILWRLRQYSGLSDMELASKLTIGRLKDFAETDKKASEKLIDWLSNLPVDLRAPVLIQTTFSLVRAVQQDEHLAQETLEKWSSMLPQLHSESFQEVSINKNAWLEPTVIPHDLSPQQQLLAVIWLLTRIWALRPNVAGHFADMSLRDEFERTFSCMEGVEDFDRLSRVVLTLDTLPLPRKNQIFPFFQYFREESLFKMLGHDEYRDGLNAFSRTEYVQLQDNGFVQRARRNHPGLIISLAETINSDLPQFQAMAQILILRGNENFRIVKRLLDYNMEMRFALTKSWTSTTKNEIPSDLKPSLILKMLEKLIMTFAVTPVVSPRSAFRQVYKMYLFLHKVGAPINPVIGRALWYAGVTRFGQTGAARAQVLWCLAKVRELEGEDVANRLLWSSGFRKTFLRDFLHELDASELPALLRDGHAAVAMSTGCSSPNRRKV